MILHIDMDAFYASVEQLDHPELKGKPVIVGGSSNRGVVTAASYEARKFGVHSAMPVFKARQRCPHGIFVHGRMHRYKEVSKRIMRILKDFSPLVEPVSIDEAYMDIAGCRRLFGGPVAIGQALKETIRADTALTCSVGIAPNKFLAKIASDVDKPDGLFAIMTEDVADFIATLPIRKVPGVGRKMYSRLEAMGIVTLGNVTTYPPDMLQKKLGKFGKRLRELAAGIDSSKVSPDTPHKSVSTERTLASDTDDRRILRDHILKQSEEVARQLRKSGLQAKTIVLKVKHSDFKRVTRNLTLERPTQSSKVIFGAAVSLFDKYRLTQKVRLIGVGASSLLPLGTPVQMTLFGKEQRQDNNWEKVDQVVDGISAKFGKDAIRRATLKDK